VAIELPRGQCGGPRVDVDGSIVALEGSIVDVDGSILEGDGFLLDRVFLGGALTRSVAASRSSLVELD
jgi:hypothetical protein